MEAKEKAIMEAYGEHWDKVKEFVNSYDGICRKLREPHEKLSFDNDHFGTSHDWINYRPKSLSGIETNNGWIRIESDKDNPIEGGCYWCLCYEEVKIVSYSCKLNTWLSSGVTHYQPIIKPLKPIY